MLPAVTDRLPARLTGARGHRRDGIDTPEEPMSYQDANVPDGPRPDRFAADAHGYGDEGLLASGQAQETEAGLTAARAESAAMAEQLAAQQERLTRLFTAAVVGSDGERIGKVGQVYLDDQTQEPNWVTVKTGLFGTKEFFVPLDEARLEGKQILVPYGKAHVLAAPATEIDQNLSPEEEDALYNHYRVPGRQTGTQAGVDPLGAPGFEAPEHAEQAAYPGPAAQEPQDPRDAGYRDHPAQGYEPDYREQGYQEQGYEPGYQETPEAGMYEDPFQSHLGAEEYGHGGGSEAFHQPPLTEAYGQDAYGQDDPFRSAPPQPGTEPPGYGEDVPGPAPDAVAPDPYFERPPADEGHARRAAYGQDAPAADGEAYGGTPQAPEGPEQAPPADFSAFRRPGRH